MVIEEKDFKLTPISDDSIFYDLELLYKIQPKGKECRYEFKIAAYGIPLETALLKIAHYRTNIKKDVSDLKSYITELKKEIQLLRDNV